MHPDTPRDLCYCDYMGGMCGYCIDALQAEQERPPLVDLRVAFPAAKHR